MVTTCTRTTIYNIHILYIHMYVMSTTGDSLHEGACSMHAWRFSLTSSPGDGVIKHPGHQAASSGTGLPACCRAVLNLRGMEGEELSTSH